MPFISDAERIEKGHIKISESKLGNSFWQTFFADPLFETCSQLNRIIRCDQNGSSDCNRKNHGGAGGILIHVIVGSHGQLRILRTSVSHARIEASDFIENRLGEG